MSHPVSSLERTSSMIPPPLSEPLLRRVPSTNSVEEEEENAHQRRPLEVIQRAMHAADCLESLSTSPSCSQAVSGSSRCHGDSFAAHLQIILAAIVSIAESERVDLERAVRCRLRALALEHPISREVSPPLLPSTEPLVGTDGGRLHPYRHRRPLTQPVWPSTPNAHVAAQREEGFVPLTGKGPSSVTALVCDGMPHPNGFPMAYATASHTGGTSPACNGANVPTDVSNPTPDEPSTGEAVNGEGKMGKEDSDLCGIASHETKSPRGENGRANSIYSDIDDTADEFKANSDENDDDGHAGDDELGEDLGGLPHVTKSPSARNGMVSEGLKKDFRERQKRRPPPLRVTPIEEENVSLLDPPTSVSGMTPRISQEGDVESEGAVETKQVKENEKDIDMKVEENNATDMQDFDKDGASTRVEEEERSETKEEGEDTKEDAREAHHDDNQTGTPMTAPTNPNETSQPIKELCASKPNSDEKMNYNLDPVDSLALSSPEVMDEEDQQAFSNTTSNQYDDENEHKRQEQDDKLEPASVSTKDTSTSPMLGLGASDTQLDHGTDPYALPSTSLHAADPVCGALVASCVSESPAVSVTSAQQSVRAASSRTSSPTTRTPVLVNTTSGTNNKGTTAYDGPLFVPITPLAKGQTLYPDPGLGTPLPASVFNPRGRDNNSCCSSQSSHLALSFPGLRGDAPMLFGDYARDKTSVSLSGRHKSEEGEGMLSRVAAGPLDPHTSCSMSATEGELNTKVSTSSETANWLSVSNSTLAVNRQLSQVEDLGLLPISRSARRGDRQRYISVSHSQPIVSSVGSDDYDEVATDEMRSHVSHALSVFPETKMMPFFEVPPKKRGTVGEAQSEKALNENSQQTPPKQEEEITEKEKEKEKEKEEEAEEEERDPRLIGSNDTTLTASPSNSTGAALIPLIQLTPPSPSNLAATNREEDSHTTITSTGTTCVTMAPKISSITSFVDSTREFLVDPLDGAYTRRNSAEDTHTTRAPSGSSDLSEGQHITEEAEPTPRTAPTRPITEVGGQSLKREAPMSASHGTIESESTVWLSPRSASGSRRSRRPEEEREKVPLYGLWLLRQVLHERGP